MASRSTYKIITPEVRAIKRLRERKGLSVYKAAIKVGTNKSTLTALENGRINITKAWIDKIIKGYGINEACFHEMLNSNEPSYDELMGEIMELANKLTIEKLKVIKNLLMNF